MWSNQGAASPPVGPSARLLPNSTIPRCEQVGPTRLLFFFGPSWPSLVAILHYGDGSPRTIHMKRGHDGAEPFLLELPPPHNHTREEGEVKSPFQVEVTVHSEESTDFSTGVLFRCAVMYDCGAVPDESTDELLEDRRESAAVVAPRKKRPRQHTEQLSREDKSERSSGNPPSSDRDEANISHSVEMLSLSSHDAPTADDPLEGTPWFATPERELEPIVGEKRYLHPRKVGRGGFGCVYRAESEALGIDVAVKVLNCQSEAIYREAHLLARIRHPNVVEVKDAFIDQEKRVCIVMEFLRGRTLRGILHDRGYALSLGEVMHLATSVLRALHAIHDEGLFHCDLKPENIAIEPRAGETPRSDQPSSIGPDSIVKILDFGIAVTQAEGEAKGKPTKPWGTAEYRSREQQGGSLPVTCMTDLFQLARVMEDCLRSSEEPVPTPLQMVIHKAKQYRYASAMDMLGDLAVMVMDHEGRPLLRDVCQSLNLPFIFDRAGKGGYKRENIQVSFKGNSTAVPPEYRQAYLEYLNAPRGPGVWDGAQLALKQALKTREPLHEEHGLALTYTVNGYFHALAMKKVFNEKLAPIERERMRSPFELSRFTDPQFYTSCGVHIGIITTDNRLVFLRRSTQVAQSNAEFTCGAVEGMSADMDMRRGVPCPFRAAVRALDEEVGIKLVDPQISGEHKQQKKAEDKHVKEEALEAASSNIHLLGLICKPRELQWGFVGYVDLREPQIPERCRLSSTQMEALMRGRVPKDSFEHDLLLAVPFMVDPVLDFLRQKRESVVPSAVACALFILFDRFEEHHVLLTALKQ